MQCSAINIYERFVWTCPRCKNKFKLYSDPVKEFGSKTPSIKKTTVVPRINREKTETYNKKIKQIKSVSYLESTQRTHVRDSEGSGDSIKEITKKVIELSSKAKENKMFGAIILNVLQNSDREMSNKSLKYFFPKNKELNPSKTFDIVSSFDFSSSNKQEDTSRTDANSEIRVSSFLLYGSNDSSTLTEEIKKYKNQNNPSNENEKLLFENKDSENKSAENKSSEKQTSEKVIESEEKEKSARKMRRNNAQGNLFHPKGKLLDKINISDKKQENEKNNDTKDLKEEKEKSKEDSEPNKCESKNTNHNKISIEKYFNKNKRPKTSIFNNEEHKLQEKEEGEPQSKKGHEQFQEKENKESKVEPPKKEEEDDEDEIVAKNFRKKLEFKDGKNKKNIENENDNLEENRTLNKKRKLKKKELTSDENDSKSQTLRNITKNLPSKSISDVNQDNINEVISENYSSENSLSSREETTNLLNNKNGINKNPIRSKNYLRYAAEKSQQDEGSLKQNYSTHSNSLQPCKYNNKLCFQKKPSLKDKKVINESVENINQVPNVTIQVEINNYSSNNYAINNYGQNDSVKKKSNYNDMRHIEENSNNSAGSNSKESNSGEKTTKENNTNENKSKENKSKEKKSKDNKLLRDAKQRKYAQSVPEFPVLDFDPEDEKKKENIEYILQKILRSGNIPKFPLEKYKILKQLGSGTYATIYLVENKDTKERLAMKKIIAQNTEEAEQYYNEFKLINIFQHPNIVQVKGLVMKLLDITTIVIYVIMEVAALDWDAEIKKRFQRRKYYTEKELIKILKEIVSPLTFLQRKKIAHRDIKPPNILIFQDNTYKLADFGEARSVEKSKQFCTLRGTESFMAPILYEGNKEDKDIIIHNPYKSDVFSLGYCMIYASNLDFSIIPQIRKIHEIEELRKILKDNFNIRYSDKYINLLLCMIEFTETYRFDFLKLARQLEKDYPKDEEDKW